MASYGSMMVHGTLVPVVKSDADDQPKHKGIFVSGTGQIVMENTQGVDVTLVDGEITQGVPMPIIVNKIKVATAATVYLVV